MTFDFVTISRNVLNYFVLTLKRGLNYKVYNGHVFIAFSDEKKMSAYKNVLEIVNPRLLENVLRL